MREGTHVGNRLGGTVDGPAVQAGIVHGDVSITAPARMAQVVREFRSLRLTAYVYRFLVSVIGCAAVAGVSNGATPLTALAGWCDALSLPAGWTGAAAAWTAGRGEGLGVAATAMVTVGLFTMPAPRRPGGDLGEILHWRGPSTTVLGLALAAQCGFLTQLAVQTLLWAAVVLWFFGRYGAPGFSRTDQVKVAAMGILLATAFAPIALLVWGYGRDTAEGVTRATVPRRTVP
ncbi:hypothetical protein ABZ896_10540 [Streptomyces sp. NPDC047072]|uniref:hypothetical protein n=1 Tax=Streptomyces sp. NPDC047072 TaxID=3154809 RepID=UPI00340466B3